jgi:hypothetical protein
MSRAGVTDLFGQARMLISQQPHFRGRQASSALHLRDDLWTGRGHPPTLLLKQAFHRT